MTFATFPSIFTGTNQRMLKAQYGLFLARDYNGQATDLAAYSPFDPATGQLSSTLLTTDGWLDCGYLDENGVKFTPKVTTTELMAWQSRLSQRTDLTLDQEGCTATLLESTTIGDALTYHMPLSTVQENGVEGYQITKSNTPSLFPRQLLAIGVDYNTGTPEYFATEYSLARMTKPGDYEYSDKSAVLTPLTFDSYLDPYSGFSVRRFREGPAWRASGGSTTAPGTPVALAVSGGKATLTFTPPTSLNGPFTYTVNQTLSSVTTAVLTSNTVVSSSSPTSVVLTVSGLTPSGGSYTFTVQATGSNGSLSPASAASNSITSLT